MRKIASLAVLLILATGAFADEVKLLYTRPSALITMFAGSIRTSASPFVGSVFDVQYAQKAIIGRLQGSTGGIIPEGVTLIAHDSRGILEINGPDSEVRDVRRYVELMDVQPRRVHLDLSMSCPTLHVDIETKTTLLNNRPWETRDSTTRLNLGVAPRINDDGTLTLYIKWSRVETEKASIVVRIKPGEEIRLSIGKNSSYSIDRGQMIPLGNTSKIAADKSQEGDIDDPEVLVKIKAQVLDELKKGAKKAQSLKGNQVPGGPGNLIHY